MFKWTKDNGKCPPKADQPRVETKRRGQGLIETIIGMSVLVTGIVSLMSIVVAASTARTANEYITVASNLAREGIEVVVAKRNDNWIKGNAFDHGFDYDTDYTYAPLFDDPWELEWRLCPDPDAMDDEETKVYRFTDAGSFPGLMYQAEGGTPYNDSEYTGYRRLLALDRICDDETIVTSGSACSGSPGKIGIRITSTVEWIDRGVSHNISAIETIYDWK